MAPQAAADGAAEAAAPGGAKPAARVKFLVQPDQTQQQRLNRFQAALTGASAVLTSEVLDVLEDRTLQNDVSALVHGPMYGKGNDKETKKQVLLELTRAFRDGAPHLQWTRFQREAAARDPALADDPMGINIAVPRIISSDAEMPFINYVVLISDKDDAARIARIHVKKQPNFTAFFFQSLIATTDNEHWRRQRAHLQDVFLPKSSLAKIFPTSLARAKHCAERLGELARGAGPFGVQMHEFFLHEAQAQLQMALFGMDADFMERTNADIRAVFSGTQPDPNFGKDMCLAMMSKVNENEAFAAASDAEVLQGKKPVFGPLSKSVADAAAKLDMSLYDQFGNMMLILFAGHDTTAHTMTWFTFEMARHPEHQARLHAEVDAMFESLGGRDMTYEDCAKLPFMTRCVMETLRLWPAVPNGTFRELQFDEEVRGPGGKPVTLPKGTYVQIVNWMRHRSPKLWGPDVEVFNPDRAFTDNEVWGGCPFHATNPASERFSPFTFKPRDCLGKNFAQMEMRTILSNVFRRFSFELSEPYAKHDPSAGPIENVGGTMGPRDLTPEGIADSEERCRQGKGPSMAMYLRAVPRQPGAASRM